MAQPAGITNIDRLRARLRELPWRKVALGAVVTLLLFTFVAPLRRVALNTIGTVVLFVATPLAPDTADFSQMPGTARLLAADGSVIGDVSADGGHTTSDPLELKSVPEPVRNAVLAAEDKNFYHHGGVDPQAVTRALFSTLRGRTQGGSTITQQLAKLNYTAGEHTLLRKVREALYATKLERRYSKDELLERYINQVYFGEGAYGLKSAARTFFATTPEKLTPSQAATLAGKIRAPEFLNPRKRLREVTRRRNQVLVNMKREGWLGEADYQAALAEAITLAPPTPTSAGRAPHFVAYVEREAKTLDALGGSPETRASQFFTGGYEIETTLEPKVFDATVAAVQARLGAAGDPTAAAATVKPGDGAIRSLFGGLDFASTQFDMSSLGGRQAGSSFKPFVYMAALRAKIDPRSTFDGSSGRVIPCYGDKPVANYAGEDASGAITVDDALVHSVNVVFVDLGCQVGPKAVVNAANDDGIPDDATTDQGAVFLGGLDGRGVNALEMASAFATFGADGVYATPYAIARIKDSKGRVVYEHHVATERAFSAEEVGVINRPLQDVVRRGTGRAAAIGRSVGGKTGTTQNNVDAWFAGFTPDLATGVWVGYAKPKPMNNVHGRSVTGGSFPAMIFGDVMKAAHRGIPAHQLHTVSPDALGLHMVSTKATEAPPESTTTSIEIVVVDPNTTLPGEETTTTQKPPKTTNPPPKTTTTTGSPGPTTTAKQKEASATTTTTPP
ncbi:MAG: penicillin-binding protein [Actinomycetota bacterium]|jgi:penicillin-binding protein 1A